MMLQANQLHYGINGQPILRGVDLELERGEFVGLIGPNGSGKSSLLKCLCGLWTVDRGRIELGGRDLGGWDPRPRARTIAFLEQQARVDFDFRVRDIVAMGRAPHRGFWGTDSADHRRVIREALRTVAMEDKADRVFRNLSGGERQRVLIARCLAQQAEVMLLDEPTNHLDVNHALDILDLLRDLSRTVLVAIHDLNLASSYCDRLCVMKGGRIVAEGEPSELLSSSFVAEVFGCSPEILPHPATGRPQALFTPGESSTRE